MTVVWPPPDPDLAYLARKNIIVQAEQDQAGKRLDRFAAWMTGLSRGKSRALIDFGSVWVEGRVCRKQSRLVRMGETVTVQVPEYGPVRFYEADPERIIYEDDWFVAYDKEANIPCQQTPYDGYNHLFGALKRTRGDGYLALHHRLDSPTSGVMIFAGHPGANAGLSRLFSQGPLTKIYLAVVRGQPADDAWEVDRPIAKQNGRYFCPPDGWGKSARTLFTIIGRGQDRSLVQAQPLTGRTHQIRLHLAAVGHPVLGDVAYDGPPAPRLMLHALSLSFKHPQNKRPLTIEAPRPAGFMPEDLLENT